MKTPAINCNGVISWEAPLKVFRQHKEVTDIKKNFGMFDMLFFFPLEYNIQFLKTLKSCVGLKYMLQLSTYEKWLSESMKRDNNMFINQFCAYIKLS